MPQRDIHDPSIRESGRPGGGAGRRDEVGGSGIWPASMIGRGEIPPDAEARAPGMLGQTGRGGRGEAGYYDSGSSGLGYHYGQVLGGYESRWHYRELDRHDRYEPHPELSYGRGFFAQRPAEGIPPGPGGGPGGSEFDNPPRGRGRGRERGEPRPRGFVGGPGYSSREGAMSPMPTYGYGAGARSGGEAGYRGNDFQVMGERSDLRERTHAGRGPKGYRRSNERIHEELCERLADHPAIDASDMEVRVEDGVVTLSGTVPDRYMKRLAEDVAEEVFGVTEVRNAVSSKQ